MLNSHDNIRIRIILVSAVLFIGIIYIVRVFYRVQIQKHDYYLNMAKSRYTTSQKIDGRRGEIFDVNGYLLVGNTPRVNISCSPNNLKNDYERQRCALLLSNFFPGSFRYFYSRLSPTRQVRNRQGKPVLDEQGRPKIVPNKFFMVARNCKLATADAFKAALKPRDRRDKRQNLSRGIFFFDPTTVRTYPKGRLLANVLGYVNISGDEDHPQSGLEKELDRKIAPTSGKLVYERTRDGIPLSYGIQKLRSAHDGKNIYLTINEPIQAILEEELDTAYHKWNPRTIYAAIANPKTGDILALAQRPTFDPNDRSTYTPLGIRSLIAEDAYEPGSLAKPFAIGKALDWKIVRPNDLIDCEKGRWIFHRRALTDSHRYDKLTVSEVIQKSSNIGTAKIALMMGENGLYRALWEFGIGQKTNLPFPLEHPGLLRPVKKWDKLSISRFPIGYGIQVSPLQLLRAYCALANNGRMPKLRLIDRVVDPRTGKAEKTPYLCERQVFQRPETGRELVDMMIRVTEKGGTATRAGIAGFEVAGKTGTSRKYIPHKGYSMRDYYASFIGFVPARKAELVMVVTVDSPRGGTYGGTVSGPVFKQTMTRVLRLLNIQPQEPEFQ